MQTRITLLILTAVAIASTCARAADDHAAQMAERLTLFKNEVRPLLVESCLKCHGGDKVRSEFSLATREDLLAGGDIGIPVIPGNSKRSPLFDYLTHKEEPYMPPKKPQLPAESIAAIAKWIDLGAAYDRPLADSSAKEKGPMQVTDAERKTAIAFSAAQIESHNGDKNRALADLRAALMSANEFVYVE